MKKNKEANIFNQQATLGKEKRERRKFIKQVVFAGSLVSTSLVSNNLLAKNTRSEKQVKKENEFSYFPTGFIYFNSGTEGSMPKVVIDSLNHAQQKWASDPTTSYETDPILGKHQHQGRAHVAKALSVKKNNICFTDNTTMGMNMVLMGINFKSSDKIIITNHEHNAIISPLTVQQHKLGLNVIKRSFPAAEKLASMSADDIIDKLFPDTSELKGAKALCVSHVYPTTGIRLPLNKLRRKADQLGIRYLVVDGAQAFGMINLSDAEDAISYADFYACPGHKWLNGPPSTGILYIKNENISPPEFYPVMSQRMTKYTQSSTAGAEVFPMTEALQVRGCSNAPGFVAMQTAIDFQQKLGGFSRVEKQIISMSSQVKRFIKARSSAALISPTSDPRLESGLSVFFPFSWNAPEKIYRDKETAAQIVKTLLEQNIQIRYIGFDDPSSTDGEVYALRVSTAIFNDQKQLQLLFDNLKIILSKL